MVEQLTHWCAEVLKYPTREANIKGWMTMEMGELRRVHGNWKSLMESRKPVETVKLFQ